MLSVEFDAVLKQKSAYTFWVKEHVRFTDLDVLGHVSAVRTNEYFNSARAAFLEQAIDKWPHAEQLPVVKLAIVSHEREMHFPGDITVGMKIEKWGNTSLTVVLGVFVGDDCMALSRNLLIVINAQTRLPVPLYDQTKQNFITLAG